MTRHPLSRLAPPLAALALLAACAAPGSDGPGLRNPFAPEPVEPEAAPVLPASVQAALPPGVPASVVIPDGSGCYLYSVERTDPPSGYPLRDAAGNQVCDPGVLPAQVVAAAPIPTVAGLAAQPAAATDDGTIDITPVLTAPLPAGPAQGNIAPPAPLAPLNG